jgi:hypothetical protein
MTYTNQMEQETAKSEGLATNSVRVGGQILGLVLTLIGAYFAIMILSSCIAVLRDPGQSANSVTAMTKTLGIENAQITSGKDQIPIGKISAGVMLLAWYQVAAWISIRLMVVGGQMVSSGRRELIAAMREFDILRRNPR